MHLSVSNIAWHRGDDASFLSILREFGFTGVDIAPTKVWPDWNSSVDDWAAFAKLLDGFGLSAIGMQSIFFGTQGLNVFAAADLWSETKRHLRRVARLARGIGATRVVFGAPANRDPGEIPPERAYDIALRRLRRLASIFDEQAAVLCMEPVPAEVGGKFLRTTLETAEFVRAVGHRGIALNLDAAFLTAESVPVGDTIQACADVIAHVHASEPGLSDFAQPRSAHAEIASALRAVGYRGAVAIEMRGVAGMEEPNLRAAMSVVRQCYGTA